MPKLSSPVGRGAPNRQHDAALVQAALASLPSTNNPFGRKIWSKPVDGRASPELEAAIHQFQSVNRINPTGRVDVMGADMQIMDRLLPQDRKGIAAVENCTAVLCSGLQSHMVGEARRVAKERTLLPSAAAEQLSDFIRNIQNQMSLTLCPDGHAIDFQGRMVQKLAFADTHWLNGQGQFTPQAPADKANMWSPLFNVARSPACWNGILNRYRSPPWRHCRLNASATTAPAAAIRSVTRSSRCGCVSVCVVFQAHRNRLIGSACNG